MSETPPFPSATMRAANKSLLVILSILLAVAASGRAGICPSVSLGGLMVLSDVILAVDRPVIRIEVPGEYGVIVVSGADVRTIKGPAVTLPVRISKAFVLLPKGILPKERLPEGTALLLFLKKTKGGYEMAPYDVESQLTMLPEFGIFQGVDSVPKLSVALMTAYPARFGLEEVVKDLDLATKDKLRKLVAGGPELPVDRAEFQALLSQKGCFDDDAMVFPVISAEEADARVPEIIRRFCRALGAGDRDGLLALALPGSSFAEELKAAPGDGEAFRKFHHIAPKEDGLPQVTTRQHEVRVEFRTKDDRSIVLYLAPDEGELRVKRCFTDREPGS